MDMMTEENVFPGLDQKNDRQTSSLREKTELRDSYGSDLVSNNLVSAWRQFTRFEGLTYQEILLNPSKSSDEEKLDRNSLDSASSPCDRFVAEFDRRALAARSAGCAYTDTILAFKLLEKCGIDEKKLLDLEQFLSSVPVKTTELQDKSNNLLESSKLSSCDTVLTSVKTFVRNLLIVDDQVLIKELIEEEEIHDSDNFHSYSTKYSDPEDDLQEYVLEDKPDVINQLPVNLNDIVDAVLEEERSKNTLNHENLSTDQAQDEVKTLLPDDYLMITDRRTVDVRLRPIIRCGECLFLTDSKEEMTKHAESRHKQLQCPDCPHVSSGESKLKVHMKTNHGHFMMRCRKCELDFGTWASYTTHNREKHEGDSGHRYECHECDKVYTYFPFYAEHIKQAHKGLIFTCDKCNMTFGTNKHFLAHKKTHRQHRPCKDCNKKFTSKKALVSHRLKIHGVTAKKKKADEVAEHLCENCDESFATQKALTLHSRRKHGADENCSKPSAAKCTECPESFSSERTLNHHLRLKHKPGFTTARADLGQKDAKNCVCEECGKSFTGRRNLFWHRRSVHLKERHLCKECPRVFNSKRLLLVHENNAHSDNPVDESELCDQCGHRAVHKAALAQHKRKMHKYPRRHACPHCDYTNYDSYKLRIHINVKHTSKMLKCKDCDFEHTSLQQLYQHAHDKHVGMNDDHQIENNYDDLPSSDNFNADLVRPISCVMCRYESNKSSLIREHFLKTHELTAFECSPCGIMFEADYMLKNHQRKVHERRYSCKKCGHTAPHATALKLHIQIKHEGKTFPCKQCEYVATNPNSLWRHKHLVHNMKRFYCDQCDYMAKDNFTLKIHKEKKHEGIEHVCDECGMKFNTPTSLKKHRGTKHQTSDALGVAKYGMPGLLH